MSRALTSAGKVVMRQLRRRLAASLLGTPLASLIPCEYLTFVMSLPLNPSSTPALPSKLLAAHFSFSIALVLSISSRSILIFSFNMAFVVLKSCRWIAPRWLIRLELWTLTDPIFTASLPHMREQRVKAA